MMPDSDKSFQVELAFYMKLLLTSTFEKDIFLHSLKMSSSRVELNALFMENSMQLLMCYTLLCVIISLWHHGQ